MSTPGHSRYAQQISQMLENSNVWSRYQGQNHDLFLPIAAARHDNTANYLENAQLLAIEFEENNKP